MFIKMIILFKLAICKFDFISISKKGFNLT